MLVEVVVVAAAVAAVAGGRGDLGDEEAPDLIHAAELKEKRPVVWHVPSLGPAHKEPVGAHVGPPAVALAVRRRPVPTIQVVG